MTIDEAIKHCKEMAEKNEEMCRVEEIMGLGLQNTEMMKCARTHKQLAEWLTELKELKEQEPILDKIRTEIDRARFIDKDTRHCRNALASGLEVALDIIDKYRTESEVSDERIVYTRYYSKNV